MKIRFLSLVIAMVLPILTPTHGQFLTLPLWPGGIPNQEVIEPEKAESSDMLRVSNVHEPEIAVFLPAKSHATGQAVVVCPGGGYAMLAYDWEGTDVAKWLNSKGIVAIVLKYRLPNSKKVSHEAPLADAQRAIRMTREHASEWDIDPSKVGIMGYSAGGHLASTAGTHFDLGDYDAKNPVDGFSCRPDFMILVYPVISFTDEAICHIGSKRNLIGENPSKELETYYSNELQITEDTPPTILIHAADDISVSVENSIVFYKELQAKGISSEMHLYPYGGHGFSFAIGKGHLSTWPDRVIEWLNWLDENI